MQKARKIFTLRDGLLPLCVSISIEYKDEELYSVFLKQVPADESKDMNFLQNSFLSDFTQTRNIEREESISPDGSLGDSPDGSLGYFNDDSCGDDFAQNVFTQLTEYFEGKRKSFDIPLHLVGTAFQQSVWKALTDIPYGEVCSYKDIAVAVGNDKASRAVGMANNKNPVAIIVPCHRVLGANGALVGYASGLQVKSTLLGIEKGAV